MSSTLTKKQQKSQSFRAKGSKGGNKKEPRIPDDVPEQDLLDDDHDSEAVPTISVTEPKVDVASGRKETETTEPDGKKKSKSKLSKEKKLREKLAREAEAAGTGTGAATGDKKRKREDLIEPTISKVEKGKSKAVDGEAEGDETKETGVEGEVKEKKKTKKDIKQRFILFVGHLSFKTTSSEVAAYFARETGHSPSVRLLTTKPAHPGSQPKSRGIAFIEFPTSTALQAALKLHHTELDGKRINVELTAGGGGATEERKKKIVERNQRVGEQRVKRKEREAEEEGEEAADGDKTVGEDGEPVKKKTKVRGGRRGKADGEGDGKDAGALAGWAARAKGTFASAGTGPSPRGGRGGRGSGRGGSSGGGRGRSDGGGRGGGRGGGSGGGSGRYWEPTGSNAMVVG